MLSDLLLLFFHIFKSIGLLFVPSALREKKILEDDVILITGGGSGLGRQFALSFARRGARKLVLWDVSIAGLKETADLVKQESPSCSVETQVVDVTNRSQVYAAADQIKKDVGIVTYLLNNAGIVSGSPILTTPDEKIIKTFEVNTISHFWVRVSLVPTRNPSLRSDMCLLLGQSCCCILLTLDSLYPLFSHPDCQVVSSWDDRAKPGTHRHHSLPCWSCGFVSTSGLRSLKARSRRLPSSVEAGAVGWWIRRDTHDMRLSLLHQHRHVCWRQDGRRLRLPQDGSRGCAVGQSDPSEPGDDYHPIFYGSTSGSQWTHTDSLE